MVAFAEPSRPTRRAPARPCEGSSPFAPGKNSVLRSDRNQQYSVTALTNGSGTIVERYSYTAYGQPAFFDGSGTVISASAESNRYTYTGREWDQGLSLYHYRARMYHAVAGRFCSRDPIGFEGGINLYRAYFAPAGMDPTGMISCADFLGGSIDPTDWPERARTQWNRGAHIFCGSCNFEGGETWNDGRQCHVCLHSGIDLTEEQWNGLLMHELIHCSQFKCGRKADGPWIGDPISPPKPQPRPDCPDPKDCTECKNWERNAYEIQCRHLFPSDSKKRNECIRAGICFSCKGRCGGLKAFDKDCDKRKFPTK